MRISIFKRTAGAVVSHSQNFLVLLNFRYQLSMATVAGNCFMNAGIAHQLKLKGPADFWCNLYSVTRALWEKKGSLCSDCGEAPRGCNCPWDETKECHEARKMEEDLMPWAMLIGR